jgi:hypothetical protein
MSFGIKGLNTICSLEIKKLATLAVVQTVEVIVSRLHSGMAKRDELIPADGTHTCLLVFFIFFSNSTRDAFRTCGKD